MDTYILAYFSVLQNASQFCVFLSQCCFVSNKDVTLWEKAHLKTFEVIRNRQDQTDLDGTIENQTTAVESGYKC